MDLNTEKEEFLRWLAAQNKREKQYSVPNTLAAYGRTLEHLAKFLVPDGGEVDPTQITRIQIEEFIVSGVGEGGGDVKPRTINQRLAAVRALYKFLKRDHPELTDPTAGIRFERTKQSEALHVTEEDGNSLLGFLWVLAPPGDAASFTGRDAATDSLWVA